MNTKFMLIIGLVGLSIQCGGIDDSVVVLVDGFLRSTDGLVVPELLALESSLASSDCRDNGKKADAMLFVQNARFVARGQKFIGQLQQHLNQGVSLINFLSSRISEVLFLITNDRGRIEEIKKQVSDLSGVVTSLQNQINEIGKNTQDALCRASISSQLLGRAAKWKRGAECLFNISAQLGASAQALKQCEQIAGASAYDPKQVFKELTKNIAEASVLPIKTCPPLHAINLNSLAFKNVLNVSANAMQAAANIIASNATSASIKSVNQAAIRTMHEIKLLRVETEQRKDSINANQQRLILYQAQVGRLKDRIEVLVRLLEAVKSRIQLASSTIEKTDKNVFVGCAQWLQSSGIGS